MSALKDKDGNIINDRKLITARVEEFYGELYKNQNEEPIKAYPDICLEEIPPISQTKVAYALKQMKEMKGGKAPGKDHISIDLLKVRGGGTTERQDSDTIDQMPGG